jgi:MFS family permease
MSMVLIVSACVLLVLSFGFRSSFGLFVRPITEANGWGREVISFSLAIQNLVWGVAAVFAGGLADRFGNVRVVIGGTVFYAAGIALMAGVDSPWLLNTSAVLLVGAGVAGTSFGIVLPALARAVGEEKRQWALGLGTAMGSFGQFLMVPLAQTLITSVGWVLALYMLAGLALTMAALAMPLAPHSGAVEGARSVKDQGIGEALMEAFSHRSFVLLVFGFFVCGFHVAFITAHLPAFLADAGFSPSIGAWSISIIGLCNVIGAYAAGILSGSYSKRYLLVIIYLSRAVVITVFVLTPISLLSVLLFSAVMGFLWLATVPPTSGLVAVMFGTRYMALLYGVVFLGHQVGGFLGVWLGGWAFDRFGSYDMVWWLGVGFGVFAGIVHCPIKEAPIERLVPRTA